VDVSGKDSDFVLYLLDIFGPIFIVPLLANYECFGSLECLLITTCLLRDHYSFSLGSPGLLQ